MKKVNLLGVGLLVGLSFITACAFTESKKDPIQDKVNQIISSSEKYASIRPTLQKTWAALAKNGVIEVSGTDEAVRPPFVALQGIIEHVLSCELGKEVVLLSGIIHTPMPATPLCTTGEISKDLVDPSIAADPNRLLTVKERTTIVRDFLAKGGNLIIAYPKGGLEKRTAVQQAIYKQELQNYKGRLFDKPLNCSEIPDELIGATYLFQTASGRELCFAIKMTQAKNPKEAGHFGLWYGPKDHEAVSQRVTAVKNFLTSTSRF